MDPEESGTYQNEVTMMTKRTILTFSLAAVLAGTLAFAQGPRGPRGQRGGGDGNGPAGFRDGRGGGGFESFLSPMAARALDLTDAQREAIRTEMQASGEAAKPIAEQLRNLRTQTHEAVKSGNDAAIDALADQSGALQGDLMAISLKTRSKIYNTILTAEQRTKLEEMRAEMQERVKNRRGPKPPAEGAPAPPAGL